MAGKGVTVCDDLPAALAAIAALYAHPGSGGPATPIPDDGTPGEAVLVLEERLEAAGLARYEISSFARPGFAASRAPERWRAVSFQSGT